LIGINYGRQEMAGSEKRLDAPHPSMPAASAHSDSIFPWIARRCFNFPAQRAFNWQH
jgi:hypothetical protein